jgi:hypothetical protein
VPRSTHRSRVVAALLGTAVLVLGGCGGDDADDEAVALDPAVADAEVFTDPDGGFHLSIGPTWEQLRAESPAMWSVYGPDGGEATIVIMTFPAPPTLAPDEAATAIAHQMVAASIGYEAHGYDTVDRPSGEAVTVIEATTDDGEGAIDLLQVVVVDGDRGVYAQLGTVAGDLDVFRADVEPFLLTIAVG